MNKTDVQNYALSKIGQEGITADTSDTPEAIAINYIYDATVKSVMRDHTWSCLTKRASIAALAETPIGYSYAYQMPSDIIRLLNIEGGDDYAYEGKRILTNVGPPLQVRYVAYESNPEQWDDLLVETAATMLAAQLAEKLTGSNTKHESLMMEYKVLLNKARYANGREKRQYRIPRGSWVNARLNVAD